jgi:hypothetical protein
MKTKPEKDTEFRMKSEDFDRLMRGALGVTPPKKTTAPKTRRKRTASQN